MRYLANKIIATVYGKRSNSQLSYKKTTKLPRKDNLLVHTTQHHIPMEKLTPMDQIEELFLKHSYVHLGNEISSKL